MQEDIRSLLLRILDEAYDKRAWHGPNLRGSLRGVTADQAAWRPAAGRHTIWDLAVHCAYWKYVVRRRLTRMRRGSFPREGSNWFATPPPEERQWRADLALLRDEHHALRDAVARAPRARLMETLRLIYGAAAHDTYHTGQIQLIRKLTRDSA
ncbi:MAG TPA: DinB family protein [Thermoanaerobaculia bacterium]|nr:DinB family protein [Thermoanaerobaculia bacterium]